MLATDLHLDLDFAHLGGLWNGDGDGDLGRNRGGDGGERFFERDYFAARSGECLALDDQPGDGDQDRERFEHAGDHGAGA